MSAGPIRCRSAAPSGQSDEEVEGQKGAGGSSSGSDAVSEQARPYAATVLPLT